MRTRAISFTTAIVVSACWSHGVSAQQTKNVPAAAPASAAAATDPILLESGGFVLDRPKYPKDGRRNTKLDVIYSWDGEPRHAVVGDGGTFWRVTFPTRPQTAGFVKIEYVYHFELTDADRTKLEATAARVAEMVVEKVVGATAQAHGSPAGRDELFAESSQALADAAKDSSQYSNGAGDDGAEVLLKALGLEKRGDGKWVPTDATVDFVVGASAEAEEFVSPADAAKKQAGEVTDAGSSPCWKAVRTLHAQGLDTADSREAVFQALDRETEPDATRSVLDTCWRELATVGKAIAAEVTDNALAAQKATLDRKAQTFETNPPSLRKLSFDVPIGRSDLDKDLRELQSAAADVKKEEKLKQSPAYNGVQYAWLRLEAVHHLQAYKAGRIRALAAKYDSMVEHVTTEDHAIDLLKQGGGERFYEVTTGVVYVGRVDDLVMPIMISMCPFTTRGCLPTGDIAWNKGQVGRAFALDVGVKATTLDKQDPRHEGQLGFLGGASFNPISVLRLSGGAYWFENKQDNKWNASYYVGATLNILQSAELLGVTGLGSPSAPQIVNDSK